MKGFWRVTPGTLTAAAMISLVAAMIAAALALLVPEMPAYRLVRQTYRPSDVLIEDRDGRVLQRVRVAQNYRAGAWIPYSEIPPAVIDSIVTAEDKRFFSHCGVDVRAFMRAAWRRVRGQKAGGASTLSMQTASLINPAQSGRPGRRTYLDKLRQILGALSLEASWSKEQILETYLNLVPLRGELRGLSAVSTELFGTQPQSLSFNQSLLIAAMLPSPNTSAANIETRACRLAHNAKEAASYDLCRYLKLPAAKQRDALPQVEAALSEPAARSVLRISARGTKSDASLRTTLDAELQQAAAAALQARLLPLRERYAHDGAVLIVHNKSGEVSAYVPNAGRASSRRFVDGILARRQAGSTLKPFLYAKAFERGLITPQSLLLDEPLEIAVFGGAYRPANYDNSFRGVVSAHDALGSSLNIPALRVLRMLGLPQAGKLLRELDLIRPPEADRYGYSMALGAPSVRLWDLVNAYRTLANSGLHAPLHISGSSPEAPSVRLFSADAAASVRTILSDRESRQLTFGLENALATPFWSAVKTGTSKDMTDNWCIGFTNEYTVGVWIGNFSGEPMRNVSGVSGAAPLWASLMRWLHEHRGTSAAEPARVEFFGAPASLATPEDKPARITYPADGASFAVDPDIPAEAQAVVFTARSVPNGFRWSLNGEILASARQPLQWSPRKGDFILAIVDANGNSVDKSDFSVR